MISLAVKYRPKKFEDVVGQSATVRILQNQLRDNEIKQAYLFIGSAGCGKTTCARIFANELNKGIGSPIELDAASHNSVDDIRELTKQAQMQSMAGEYKVFILDELHMLSGGAWAALLKLIEEPPAKTVFIGCTTNPEKIPKTILSRCQRFDFRRMQNWEIEQRLEYIVRQEYIDSTFDAESLEFIAKQANGGMRDAITLLDKCLSYSPDLTLDNVVKALGTVGYETYIDLFENLYYNDTDDAVRLIEKVYSDGVDLKQFVDDFCWFVSDILKYYLTKTFDYLLVPQTVEIEDFLDWFVELFDNDPEELAAAKKVLDLLLNIKTEIKYDSNPKYLMEAMIISYGE
ncbi:MAG: DNA polymerase III subunit gamma/tau [Bacteroidales bacterium]|nr:DNA polymerase III subunit gamma/tau [Bacteroidales bacterium]